MQLFHHQAIELSPSTARLCPEALLATGTLHCSRNFPSGIQAFHPSWMELLLPSDLSPLRLFLGMLTAQMPVLQQKLQFLTEEGKNPFDIPALKATKQPSFQGGGKKNHCKILLNNLAGSHYLFSCLFENQFQGQHGKSTEKYQGSLCQSGPSRCLGL